MKVAVLQSSRKLYSLFGCPLPVFFAIAKGALRAPMSETRRKGKGKENKLCIERKFLLKNSSLLLRSPIGLLRNSGKGNENNAIVKINRLEMLIFGIISLIETWSERLLS